MPWSAPSSRGPRTRSRRSTCSRPRRSRRRAILADADVRAILLDVRLPDGSGLDLATEMRQRSDRPWIVVMSASVHPDDQRHAYAAGADLFLGKPIAPGRLTGVLQRIAHGGSRGDGRPQP